jgi:hypothetical protein
MDPGRPDRGRLERLCEDAAKGAPVTALVLVMGGTVDRLGNPPN